MATALSGWLGFAATLLPPASPERIIPTLVFLAFGPGAACVGLYHRVDGARGDALEDLAFTVMLSLGTAALVSEAMYLAHVFTLDRAFAALAALTTLAALCPGRRSGPSRSERRRTSPGRQEVMRA
jgi:hypothetical protein